MKRKGRPAPKKQPATAEIPEGFLDSMKGILGDGFADFRNAMLQPPATSIRLNSSKPLQSDIFPGVEKTPVEWCNQGIYLSERPKFTLLPHLHAGAFYVQEAASMFHAYILRQLNVTTDVMVLDLCAAPGGKSTAILDVLQGNSFLVSNEYVGQRAAILQENMTKWGLPNQMVVNASTASLADTGLQFDVVVCDAPCSGEGMMRKDADARRQWSPQLVAECASLQREILRDAYKLTRPGGILIYSTCTFNTDEDESQAEWMANEYGMESIELEIPEGCGIASGFSTRVSSYRFMPHATRSEGLFAAVMRKRPDAETTRPRLTVPQPKAIPDIHGWIKECDNYAIVPVGGSFHAVPRHALPVASFLAERVKSHGIGCEMAEMKGSDVVPAHGLALNVIINPEAFANVELSRQEALRYLHGESLNLSSDIPTGYVRVTHEGLGLGWVNNLGTRANNLYPRPWRIHTL